MMGLLPVKSSTDAQLIKNRVMSAKFSNFMISSDKGNRIQAL